MCRWEGSNERGGGQPGDFLILATVYGGIPALDAQVVIGKGRYAKYR